MHQAGALHCQLAWCPGVGALALRGQSNLLAHKGIDVIETGHNGLKVQGGSHNLIEHCTFYQCRETGLQLSDGASRNTVLNCDSHENSDSKRENADEFACKMDVGTGNRFVGCRSWNNMDNGWNGYLRGVDSVATYYENCCAFQNGISREGVISGGDGNGFKTGGSDPHKGLFWTLAVPVIGRPDLLFFAGSCPEHDIKDCHENTLLFVCPYVVIRHVTGHRSTEGNFNL